MHTDHPSVDERGTNRARLVAGDQKRTAEGNEHQSNDEARGDHSANRFPHWRAPREVGRLPFHQLTPHLWGAHGHDRSHQVLRRQHQSPPKADFSGDSRPAAGIQPECRSARDGATPDRDPARATAAKPRTSAATAPSASDAVRPSRSPRTRRRSQAASVGAWRVISRRWYAALHRGMSALLRASEFHGGHGSAFRARRAQIGRVALSAQNLPCDVRAKFFTAHFGAARAGGPLDHGATFGRNGAEPTAPLVNSCGRQLHQSSNLRLTTEHCTSSNDGAHSIRRRRWESWVGHVPQFSSAKASCKATLSTNVDSIAS